MPTYDAILPAGGKIDDDFARVVGTTSKALIPIQGRTILDRTLDALEGMGSIGRVVLVGEKEVREDAAAKRATSVLEAGSSGPYTILNGLKHLLNGPNPPEKVLIVTTDLPYVEARMLKAFVDACPANKDVCVPLYTKEQYQARFPASESTYISLADGSWTSGGAYLVDVVAFERSIPHLERAFENRKSKIGMAKLLGPKFLIKFLTHRLTVPEVLGKVESILGCSGAAVFGTAPELAYDIDYLDDYEYAIAHP